MNDTIHQIFQDGDAYKVRITRLGELAKKQRGSRPPLTLRRGLHRLSVLGRSEPSSRSRYRRHTCGWSDLAAANRLAALRKLDCEGNVGFLLGREAARRDEETGSGVSAITAACYRTDLPDL
jgi:hypothetical protein